MSRCFATPPTGASIKSEGAGTSPGDHIGSVKLVRKIGVLILRATIIYSFWGQNLIRGHFMLSSGILAIHPGAGSQYKQVREKKLIVKR